MKPFQCFIVLIDQPPHPLRQGNNRHTMKIIENNNNGRGCFTGLDTSKPYIFLAETYIRISREAQRIMSLKQGDRVVFGIEGDSLMISVLPEMSNRKGFSVGKAGQTVNVLSVTAKQLTKNMMQKGYYIATNDIVSDGGMDWHEFIPSPDANK
jgi:hypothetical protein